ncbi:MAG TPA: PilZ domain-containing protein [Candidatus Binatia bacterium]|nr:PilZ domain-containing protein [Candidatus Binatia bacterium]
MSLKCPACGRDFVRWIASSGLAEGLLRLFSVYPFKCQLCGRRFRSFQRGLHYVTAQQDRREYDRMERKFPITFSGQNISGEGVVLDVAMGGCTFTTRSNLDVGQTVKINLRLSAAVAPVIVDAAVVRNVRREVVGVEFVGWQESERERLQLFVTGMLIGRGAALTG